jgi:hypothetical protein
VLDPLRSQLAIQRAERFVAERIVLGAHRESIERVLDIAFRASVLDDEEIRFLRGVRQVIRYPASRPVYPQSKLLFQGMRQRELALEEEIHRSKHSILPSSLLSIQY